MTWEEIKSVVQVLYPQYVGSGKLIDDTDSGVTPSSLAILFGLVHNRISGYPYDFNCLKETGTLTLTGASSYNLRTLFPGLKSVYQIYGIDENQDQEYFGNRDGNITSANGYTVRGDTLIFTGYAPTSGSATLQYKSKYLVKNSSGTRQQYFLADSDYSVLDDDDVNVLLFGLGQFINWNSDSESQDRKKEVNDWFKEAFNNMVLHNKVTNQVISFT